MEKQKILEKLRAAKAAHIRWRSYAQALMAGLPVDESKVPIIHTDCDFGKWYYGQGQELSHIPTFRAIETPHESLHYLYMKLFKLLFQEERIGLFQKLIGASERINNERKQEAEKTLDDMLCVSRTLIDTIEILEREVMSLA